MFYYYLLLGVDDAYLMIHSWQRICCKQAKNRRLAPKGALLNDSLRDRVSEVIVDVGPSITITSLTNILAFGVGMFAPTPEIRLFCAGNAVAIFFDYVYQLFMYAPIIAIVGEYEMKEEEKKDSGVHSESSLVLIDKHKEEEIRRMMQKKVRPYTSDLNSSYFKLFIVNFKI